MTIRDNNEVSIPAVIYHDIEEIRRTVQDIRNPYEVMRTAAKLRRFRLERWIFENMPLYIRGIYSGFAIDPLDEELTRA